MTTATVLAPTVRGDGITTADLFFGPTDAAPSSSTVRRGYSIASWHVVFGTPPDAPFSEFNGYPLGVGYRLAYANRTQMNPDMGFIRGWIFVIDPATLQPQIPRTTIFPSAQ